MAAILSKKRWGKCNSIPVIGFLLCILLLAIGTPPNFFCSILILIAYNVSRKTIHKTYCDFAIVAFINKNDVYNAW